MIVEFEVENAGLDQVEVLSLSAHLPIGGLDPTGGKAPATVPLRAAGRSRRPAHVLQPGARVPVSLGFNLPRSAQRPTRCRPTSPGGAGLDPDGSSGWSCSTTSVRYDFPSVTLPTP